MFQKKPEKRTDTSFYAFADKIYNIVLLGSIIVAFFLFYFAFIPVFKVEGKILDDFGCIGIGSLDVKGQIFIASNRIKYTKQIVITDKDKGIVYPEYTDLIWVQGQSPRGYWPPKYNFGHITLLLVENTVFSTESVIINEDGYHPLKHACHPRYWGIGQHYHDPHIVFEKYKQVVCIGHQHSSDWGHWFLEVFPGLIAMPQEILKNSLIALPFDRDFVVDNLASIGIPRWQLIVGNNKPYFAEKLYTINSIWCGDINRFIVVNMKKFFFEKYKLESILPEKFVICNRPLNMPRSFVNFDQIFNESIKRWPQYEWEPINQPKVINEAAKYYASIKLLFAIHGSILSNEVFMHPGTVVCELQMETWLLSFVNLGPMTGIHQVVGRDTNIKYKEVLPNVLDVNYVMRILEKAIEILNKK